MSITTEKLYEVCEETWPAARRWREGVWTLRDGQGGGKRVSAATANGPVTEADVVAGAAAMLAMGQQALFMVREGEAELDDLLERMGYGIIDPVIMYVLPIEKLTDVAIPRVTAFEIWQPLAMMREIWAAGGVGPERLDVMERAKTKTAIFSRWNEKPGGVAFAGLHEGICMVHAVEVVPAQRRQGVAQWMMRKAAFWAQAQGASQMAVLCVVENEGANRLYQALGFAEVGRYHYRYKPE